MKKCFLKDPASAITHFIALLLTICGAFPLIDCVLKQSDAIGILAISIFLISMILLYAASTLYHSLDISEKANRSLKKFDHMMISVLIAGTYTPICLISLRGTLGTILLVIIWSLAFLGIVIKAFWIYCPKWVSSVLYIGMGWTCLIMFPALLKALSSSAFGWLLAGGVIYTIGGIIYALKLTFFNNKCKSFGSHEIFHLFVMGGSFCHFIVMFCLLI